MAMNNSLNGRQPYSRSLKLVGMMQALKHAKQFVGILHIKPCSIIPDKDDHFVEVFIGAPYGNFGPLPLPSELDRIGNEIDEDEPQHGTVSITRRKGVDFPRDIAAAGILPCFAEDLLHKLIEIHGRPSGFSPPHS